MIHEERVAIGGLSVGVFDHFTFLDGAPRCPAGHEVRDLQTKDLECQMAHFYVCGARLYSEGGRHDDPASEHEVVDEILTVRQVSRYSRSTFTGEVSVYSSCDECKPVLFLREGGSLRFGGDLVEERSPWQQWTLAFDRGVLTGVEPDRCESREDVREKLARDELIRDLILDDDERLARRHFQARGRK